MLPRISLVQLLWCVALAIGLWGYVSMTTPATIYMRFPLVIDLPEERALEVQPPSEISIKVRTSGWQLLYLQYFSSEPECHVDASKMSGRISGNGELLINKMDILQGIRPSISLEKVVELNPETISLSTGMLFRGTVPVESKVSIIPRDGFDIVGTISVKPDSIVLRGNSKIVNSISSWATQKLEFKDLAGPFSYIVPLKDSLKNLITSAVKEVTISGDIQQSAEISVSDIKVEIIGAPDGHQHKIEPALITLHVRGGVKKLSTLTSQDFKVFVDYSSLINDSIGHIKPSISVPAGIHIIGMEPKKLIHRSIIKLLD